MNVFDHFSNEAKVWVYQANKPMSPEQQKRILAKAQEFVEAWSTHGKALSADAAIATPYHLVLAIDGSVQASGCSIDTSVRFIKELGMREGLDFFDRLKSVIVTSDGEFALVPFHSVKNYPECQFFHPMVSTLGELRNKWLMPVSSL